jgi:hypothetical protein
MNALPLSPTVAEPYRRTPVFDENTLPAGLRRAHRTKPGVWGVIRVLARFSDQVDSTSQALDWIKKNRNPSAQGYVEYYRRLAEGVGAQSPLGPTVAMEAPPSVQRSRINDGRVLTKGPDGLFQVPTDAVPLMLAAGWRLKESAS